MLTTLTYEYLVFMLSLSLSHENQWYRVRLISFWMTIELLTLFLGFPCTQGRFRICFWNCLCSVGLPKTRDHHFLAIHSALTSFQTSSSSCHGHCCDWNSCRLFSLDYVYISPDHTFNHPQSPFSLLHQLLWWRLRQRRDKQRVLRSHQCNNPYESTL